jgi:hypothetical protein
MKTDKELLELAAKAAGYDTLGFWHEKLGYLWDGEVWSFDPLEDDGDALRLAVKLGLTVRMSKHKHATEVWGVDEWGTIGYQEHKGDPSKATRRAIVRAAAEIGENL